MERILSFNDKQDWLINSIDEKFTERTGYLNAIRDVLKTTYSNKIKLEKISFYAQLRLCLALTGSKIGKRKKSK